jgi:hypothetical protein
MGGNKSRPRDAGRRDRPGKTNGRYSYLQARVLGALWAGWLLASTGMNSDVLRYSHAWYSLHPLCLQVYTSPPQSAELRTTVELTTLQAPAHQPQCPRAHHTGVSLSAPVGADKAGRHRGCCAGKRPRLKSILRTKD